MTENVVIAFVLTTLAGLSTGIGSAIALLSRRTNTRFLSFSLGFSAGVMLYVSFVEMLGLAREALAGVYGESVGGWAAAGSFFAGFVVIFIIDQLVPSYENPHEARSVEEMHAPQNSSSLKRLGLLTALAIGINNFPEGLATFAAALSDVQVGISIAIAIAIHNIPEGISVAVPIMYATGSRRKAFWYSFLSGVSEPLGALVGYLVLRPFFSDTLFGVLFALVAGIMVFISLDELIPTAKKYDAGHAAIYGVGLGMAVMALSLLI
ncbi:MAG: zinc transporter ZupT [Deltaproteobacteria bacterium]|nr:zinc transporter ZupT [Deltaproteobacteria bacterium]